jgi:hypothetical protein
MSLSRAVIETDHRLEGSTMRASEELAKHRWHWTLDESNPNRVAVRAYAKEVGRNDVTISRYAKGYALYLEKMAAPPGGGAYTIQDAIRQSENSVERQAFNDAIAAGSGRAVGQVARGDNRVRTNEIIAHAKDRAERRGTDPIDEARTIAEHQRKSRESAGRQRAERKKARTFRYIEIEGDLATAQRRLVHALETAEGVGFGEEEMELIRDSIGKVRAVLDLIDLRMAGTPDIDWDAELAKLGER